MLPLTADWAVVDFLLPAGVSTTTTKPSSSSPASSPPPSSSPTAPPPEGLGLAFPKAARRLSATARQKRIQCVAYLSASHTTSPLDSSNKDDSTRDCRELPPPSSLPLTSFSCRASNGMTSLTDVIKRSDVVGSSSMPLSAVTALAGERATHQSRSSNRDTSIDS